MTTDVEDCIKVTATMLRDVCQQLGGPPLDVELAALFFALRELNGTGKRIATELFELRELLGRWAEDQGPRISDIAGDIAGAVGDLRAVIQDHVDPRFR